MSPIQGTASRVILFSIKSNNKPKDHNFNNLALRPQSDEKLSDYKDSEAPPVDNDTVVGSKTESSPMDTTKLQLLLNEESFIREKNSVSNAGLQTLKDSSLPRDCPESDFSANLGKLKLKRLTPRAAIPLKEVH